MRKMVPALLAVALVAAACYTVGANFASDKVRQIQLGRTTKAQLAEFFGQPYQQGLEDGLETWTYIYLTPGRKPRSKELYIKFQEDGIVKSYSYSSNIPEETKP
jgi:outer membrane protein assembly factor BamE (lipoprotein component of BamABCDE complex)